MEKMNPDLPKLTENDRHVLKEILSMKNIPDSTIAKSMNLSPQAIFKIREKLEHSGIIKGYMPIIDFKKIGITDTKQLWEADAVKVAQKTGAPLSSVKSWQNMAELSCVKDIGPQYSELLERSGVHNIKQLKGFDTKKLLKLVQMKQNSLKINIQGNTPGYDLVENWIEQARKHRFSVSKD